MDSIFSFKKEFGLIVVGALIFTVSFLWKDLITGVMEQYFPVKSELYVRIILTLVITTVIIVVAIYLKGFFGLSNNNDKEQYKFDDNPSNHSSDDNEIN